MKNKPELLEGLKVAVEMIRTMALYLPSKELMGDCGNGIIELEAVIKKAEGK